MSVLIDGLNYTIGSNYAGVDTGTYSGSISIPDSIVYNSVTYPVTDIGGDVFNNSPNLTSITFGSNVRNIWYGYGTHFGCANLTSINVNSNNNYYSSINGVFFNKSQTTLIRFPSGKKDIVNYTIPSSVTSIGDQAFISSSLTSVTIPSSVTNIGENAFNDCKALTSVNIPSSVTNIGKGTFGYCTSLTSINIPNSVTRIMAMAFYNCNKLTNITLPSSLTTIGSPNTTPYAGGSTFGYCSSLTSITIPNSVTFIDDTTFQNCTGLTDITIPSSVTAMGTKVFTRCDNLKTINVDSNNANYSSIDGVLFNKSLTTILKYSPMKDTTDYTIPNSVTDIASSSFEYCNKLKNVTMSNSVTKIRDSAFYNCNNLVSINIPNSVTSIGDYSFGYCNSLITVFIPSSVTSIGKFTFVSCTNLTKITLSNGLKTIGDASFDIGYNYTNVIIPSSVTSLGSNVFSNSDYNKTCKCIWIRVDCVENVFIAYSNNAIGRTRVVKDGYIYYVLNGHTIEETIPTSPNPVTHNATRQTLNDQVIITWGASTDADGDTITYDLYFFNGKNWVAIKGGISGLIYYHTIPITSFNCTNAKYKVRAYDGGLYSGFVESSTFELYGVQPINTAPIISGKDEDFGQLSSPPSIIYYVNDIDEEDKLNVSITIDGDMIQFIQDVEKNKEYNVDFSSIWNGLDNDCHTLILSVTDGEYTSKTRYLFSKYIKPNYLPTISGLDTNLGQRDYSFTQSYMVDDLDLTKTLTVVEKIDNDIINTFTATRKQINTIDLSLLWGSLSIGVHKITIATTDDNGNCITRIYNFYKGNGTNHTPTINLTN